MGGLGFHNLARYADGSITIVKTFDGTHLQVLTFQFVLGTEDDCRTFADATGVADHFFLAACSIMVLQLPPWTANPPARLPAPKLRKNEIGKKSLQETFGRLRYPASVRYLRPGESYPTEVDARLRVSRGPGITSRRRGVIDSASALPELADRYV